MKTEEHLDKFLPLDFVLINFHLNEVQYKEFLFLFFLSYSKEWKLNLNDDDKPRIFSIIKINRRKIKENIHWNCKRNKITKIIIKTKINK